MSCFVLYHTRHPIFAAAFAALLFRSFFLCVPVSAARASAPTLVSRQAHTLRSKRKFRLKKHSYVFTVDIRFLSVLKSDYALIVVDKAYSVALAQQSAAAIVCIRYRIFERMSFNEYPRTVVRGFQKKHLTYIFYYR